MSNRNVSSQLEEIKKFLELYRSAEPEKGPARTALKINYKRFHAVLIWQMYIENSGKFDDVTRQFSNEYTADISQAFLTALMGFYKPSRMMLRSSIENFSRIACILDNKNSMSVKTVYALMQILKKTTLRNYPETDSAVQILIQKYGDLCDYVHTTSPLKMDLRIPFSKVVESDPVNAIACFDNIGSICQAINKILYKLCPDLLQFMHHKDADYIRDLIPASMKQGS